MPRALVTGANGFIGSHLCDELIRQGWVVSALVRRRSNLEWLTGTGTEFCYGDVTEPTSLAEPARAADCVFHVAGMTKSRDEAAYFQVNRDGTRNLLEAMVRDAGKPRRFVYVSSCAAGGLSDRDDGPVSIYGESKLAGEQVVHEFESKLPTAILRLPPVYGPRDREMIAFFRILNSGVRPVLDARFSFCYVADAIDALMRLATMPLTSSGPFVVCDGQEYLFDDWSRRILDALGKRAVTFRVEPWMVRAVAWLAERLSPEIPTLNRDKAREFSRSPWVCSNQALAAATGFEPRYDLATGLKLTIDWYRERKWL